jgi:hypothetical protein
MFFFNLLKLLKLNLQSFYSNKKNYFQNIQRFPHNWKS